MFQQKNPAHLRPLGRSKGGFAVPRCAVHQKRVGGSFGTSGFCWIRNGAPHDNSVIAENFDRCVPLPQTSGGALARAGMADEQKRLAIAPNHATRVQFDPASEAQKVRDQQFIQWILQCASGVLIGQTFPVEDDCGSKEIFVHS